MRLVSFRMLSILDYHLLYVFLSALFPLLILWLWILFYSCAAHCWALLHLPIFDKWSIFSCKFHTFVFFANASKTEGKMSFSEFIYFEFCFVAEFHIDYKVFLNIVYVLNLIGIRNAAIKFKLRIVGIFPTLIYYYVSCISTPVITYVSVKG